MLNPMDLSARTILVTGASSGIGRETAILLSQLGARVILVARDVERLQQTRELMVNHEHHIVPFDLNQVDEIPSWMKSLADEVGSIDGLVHSAGIQMTMPVRLLDNAHLEKVMRINVNAGVSLVRGIRQKNVRSQAVSVVFLSSIMGVVGERCVAAYAASKGAIEALTRSLALELASENVRVNCVAPALVHTEMAENLRHSLKSDQIAAIEAMHPLGFGTARDIAYAIAFLLADTGRWITGTTLVVDGGYMAR